MTKQHGSIDDCIAADSTAIEVRALKARRCVASWKYDRLWWLMLDGYDERPRSAA